MIITIRLKMNDSIKGIITIIIIVIIEYIFLKCILFNIINK